MKSRKSTTELPAHGSPFWPGRSPPGETRTCSLPCPINQLPTLLLIVPIQVRVAIIIIRDHSVGVTEHSQSKRQPWSKEFAVHLPKETEGWGMGTEVTAPKEAALCRLGLRMRREAPHLCCLPFL